MTRAADGPLPSTWPETLKHAFQQVPSDADWTVALSGGLDSVVLLFLARQWQTAMARPANLRALHVNHALQSRSADWMRFCEDLCRQSGIELIAETVQVPQATGVGLEAAAREARYQAFERHIGPGDVLLLAHHADDQAETLLYRLLRGAGLAGAAAMPVQRPLGQGWLHRPLLDQTRQQLSAIAHDAGLAWREDPSNQDPRFDRNFLRRQILPELRTRWPSVSQRLSRNAHHAREALALLDERAADDARIVLEPENGDLLLEPLRALNPPRQRNLIQWWLRRAGLVPLGEKQLLQDVPDLLAAPPDARPRIAWRGQVMTRFRDRVMVLDESTLEPIANPAPWMPPEALPWAGGLLSAQRTEGEGLRKDDGAYEVRQRSGGERLRLASGQHHPLKKWLQAQDLAPWERQALPLIWSGETLVAVADIWVHPEFQAQPDQPGWLLAWSSPRFRAGGRFKNRIQ